jgi:hypothetical protein
MNGINYLNFFNFLLMFANKSEEIRHWGDVNFKPDTNLEKIGEAALLARMQGLKGRHSLLYLNSSVVLIFGLHTGKRVARRTDINTFTAPRCIDF